jgi:hypothetical protein
MANYLKNRVSQEMAIFIGTLIGVIAILYSSYVTTLRVPEITITDAAMVSISTIASGAVGSLSTYFLLTRNEKRKETAFKNKVQNTIKYELRYFHDLLVDGLRTGLSDPTNESRLIIDRNSEVAERHHKLRINTTLYSLLDTPTKLRAFSSDSLIRLEYMYSEISYRFGFAMWFADAQPEPPHIGVDINKATKLKTEIADLLRDLV